MTASLNPGALVGRYRLEAEVGRGGMGVVYRAVDPALGRPVALKLLAPHLGADPAALARFRREAAAVANLKHPHIAVVYEYGEHHSAERSASGGQPFIALEWVEGRTLRAVLDQEKRLPLERALAIFDQLAAALDYAHARGVIHRDIKPSNIILGANDEATLVDFGLARLADAPAITVGTEFFGSPYYLAPEQFAGLPVDGRTDLYSLALVTYEMLAGRLPFTAATWPALVQAHLYAAPTPITELNPMLSATVEAALARALAKDPAQRFATAAGLGAALRTPPRPPAGAGREGGAGRTLRPPVSPPRRRTGADRVPRSVGLVLAAVPLFVVLAVAGLMLYLTPMLAGLLAPRWTPTPNPAQTLPAVLTPEPSSTSLAPSPTATPTSTPLALPPQTISFAPGATSGQVDGHLQAGESRSFVVRALQDQLMQVWLDSPGKDVYLAVAGSHDGPPLLSAAAQQTTWQGFLPATQDYTLTAVAGGQAADFRLRVEVPYRVVFPAGATTAVVSGTFSTGDAVSYVLFALQGQTLTATVTAPGSAASLLVVSAQDETPLVSSSSAAQSANVTLKLPASEDYIIKVVPGGGRPADFTLTITITSGAVAPALAANGILVCHAEGAAFWRPNAARLNFWHFRSFASLRMTDHRFCRPACGPPHGITQSDTCTGFSGVAAVPGAQGG